MAAAPTPGSRIPAPYVDVPSQGVVEAAVRVNFDTMDAAAWASPAAALASYDVADLQPSAHWLGGDAEVALLHRLQHQYSWAAVLWLLRVLLLRQHGVDAAGALADPHAALRALLTRRSVVVPAQATVVARTAAAPAHAVNAAGDAEPAVQRFYRQLHDAEGQSYVDRIVSYADTLLSRRGDGRVATGCGLSAFPPPLYVSRNLLLAVAAEAAAPGSATPHVWASAEAAMVDGAKRLAAGALAGLIARPDAPRCDGAHVLVLVLDTELRGALQWAHGDRPQPWPPAPHTTALPSGGSRGGVLRALPALGDVGTATVAVLAVSDTGVATAVAVHAAGAGRTLLWVGRDASGDGEGVGAGFGYMLPLAAPMHAVPASVNHPHMDAAWAAAVDPSGDGGGLLWRCGGAHRPNVVMVPADATAVAPHRQRDRVLHFVLFVAAKAVVLHYTGAAAVDDAVWDVVHLGVDGCTPAVWCGDATPPVSAVWECPSTAESVVVVVDVAACRDAAGIPGGVSEAQWCGTAPSTSPVAAWVCYPTHDELAAVAAKVRDVATFGANP